MGEKARYLGIVVENRLRFKDYIASIVYKIFTKESVRIGIDDSGDIDSLVDKRIKSLVMGFIQFLRKKRHLPPQNSTHFKSYFVKISTSMQRLIILCVCFIIPYD